MTFESDFWNWVHLHEKDAPSKLMLDSTGKAIGVDVRRAVVQIQARQKFGKKLGETFRRFPDFYVPTLLNGEQSTSDLLADYHATLIDQGATVVDLTAGLGIDAMHLAVRALNVVAVDQNEELTEALTYNAAGLGVDNLKAVNSSCEDFLNECVAEGRHFDVAFIDPARRGDEGRRLFALEDCSPDVVSLLPVIAKVADKLIIKASPMLDITSIINSLTPPPTRVIACGTATECKELIAVVDFKLLNQTPKIEGVTLPLDAEFSFTQEQERLCGLPEMIRLPKEGAYVCEAYPTVMKTGAFRLLAERFDLKMFHANTRVFYSDELKAEFPGNTYIILKVLPYASRVIKRFAKEYPQINIAARNFGMSADALRAKLGVRDGGDLRLYAVSDYRGERLLLVTKAV